MPPFEINGSLINSSLEADFIDLLVEKSFYRTGNGESINILCGAAVEVASIQDRQGQKRDC